MEQWRAIPGYEGIYEVSSLGRVKSLSRPTPMRNGIRVIRERILKFQSTAKGGYPTVDIYRKGVAQTVTIHRLVMLAFVGPAPDGLEVCHGNGDPLDNRLENLRYDSRRANRADGIRLGEVPLGEDRVTAKLTWADVDRIREMALFGARHADVAAIFDIHRNHVGKILRREQWNRRPASCRVAA